MSPLSVEQIQTLVSLISTAESDEISCEDCFGQVGQYAEMALTGRDLSAAMQMVQRHLEQCPCCRGEYEALMEALKEIDDS